MAAGAATGTQSRRRHGLRRITALVAALLSTSLAAGRGTAHDEHTGKCTIATKGDSPVARACARGGRKAAAREMKQLVKHARATGLKMKCGDCHETMEKLELKKNAEDDFKKLLAASRGR